MSKHLKYLWYVLRHKWYVFIECCKLGIPWRGLVHDMSKFLPSEWNPYVWRFYGDTPLTEFGEATFTLAWLHHQRRNPHHWQYWILVGDEDPDKVLPIPDVYRKEMLADWHGARRAGANGAQKTTKDWYLLNKDKMILHSDTRAWIEEQLGVI